MKWKHLLIAFFLIIGINLLIITLYPYPNVADMLAPFNNVLILGILGLAAIKGIDQYKNRNRKANSSQIKTK